MRPSPQAARNRRVGMVLFVLAGAILFMVLDGGSPLLRYPKDWAVTPKGTTPSSSASTDAAAINTKKEPAPVPPRVRRSVSPPPPPPPPPLPPIVVVDPPQPAGSGDASAAASNATRLPTRALISRLKSFWQSLNSDAGLTICDLGGVTSNVWVEELNFVKRVVSFVEDGAVHVRTTLVKTVEVVTLGGNPRSMLVDARYISDIGRCDVVVYHLSTIDELTLRRLRSVSALTHNALMLIAKTEGAQRLTSWGERSVFLKDVSDVEGTEEGEAQWISGSLLSMPLYPSDNLNIALTTFSSASLKKLEVVAQALSGIVAAFLRSPQNVQHDVLEGHSAEIVYERKLYSTVAAISELKTICEIGFNGGHSASLWLMVNPTATVHMFDLWHHGYSPLGEQFLRNESSRYGIVNANERLHLHRGSSLETVPRFVAENPDVKCDLLSVDGGHSYDVAKADLINMRKLANPKFHVAVIDDTNCGASYCVDRPVDEMEDANQLRVISRIAETFTSLDFNTRGVTLFQYRH